MGTGPEIEKMLSRVALGDRKAFKSLYDATSPKLFGICLRVLKDRGEAEDALQEIYFKIWRNASGFAAERRNSMAWLAVIARNHAIDRVRARKPQAVDIDDGADIADDQPDPERLAQSASEGRRIERCLQELDVARARAVRGAYVEGYSYAELAREHGVPLNTMRTWLRRSLLKLKECLER